MRENRLRRIFAALRQRSKRADIGLGLYFSYPVLNKVGPNITDTSRIVFDRMVRAVCGFESLHVRDRLLDSFAVRPRVHLYVRFDRRRKAEKRPEGTSSHVSAGRAQSARYLIS